MESTAINSVYLVYECNLENGYKEVVKIFASEIEAKKYRKLLNEYTLNENLVFKIEEEIIY